MKRIQALLLSVFLIFGILPCAVFAEEEPATNLALTAKLTASSTHELYPLSNLIDGNFRSIWSRYEYESSYIQADLGQPYRITEVVLHNRLDATADQFRMLVNVEFSNTPDFSVKEEVVAMGEEPAPYGEPVRVTGPKASYRYVRLQKKDLAQFCLAELEIYGELVDSNAIMIGADVAGTSYEYAITLLTQLGLVSPVDDDNFGVNYLLTRAEATQMVVEAFGGNVSFSGYLPFGDVNKNHPCYEDIMSAYHLGYITGDDNSSFRPNDYITKTELLFMTLRAIGYGEVVQVLFDNSVTKLVQQAEKLDLLKGVPTNDYGEPVCRGDATVVFYNALMAPAFNLYAFQEGHLVTEEDVTLLEKRYNVAVHRGVVQETRHTKLNGAQKLYKSITMVGNMTFSDPNGRLDAYLGQEVFLATEGIDQQVLLAWSTNKNVEVILPASRLISQKSDVEAGLLYAFDEDGEEAKYTLDDEFYVVKNGISHPYYTVEDVLLRNGQLRLLDHDKDNVYDVVFIEDYTLHYLNNVFYNDRELTLVDSAGVRTTVQRENLVITDRDGELLAPTKLKKDIVVKLYATQNGKNSRIVVYNKALTGQLTELADEEAAIDSVHYPFSLFYKDNRMAFSAAPGETVSAFVDEVGEILWLECDMEQINADWTIAYSQKTAISAGLDPKVKFRLFTLEGKWVEPAVADQVTVDGVPMEKSKLASLLKSSTGGLYTQELLRFKLNQNGDIQEIDTIEQSQTLDATRDFVKGEKYGTFMYTSGSSAFWDGHNMIGLAKKDTPVMTIPVVDNAYAITESNDGLFSISTVYSVCGNNARNSHNLVAYMPDEYGYPVCFIRTTPGIGSVSGSAVSQLEAIPEELAPVMVVEKATQAAKDGVVYIQLSGKNVETKADVTLLLEPEKLLVETGLLYQNKPECLDARNKVIVSKLLDFSDAELEKYIAIASEIGFGDIIRYKTVGTTVRAVERIFDYDAAKLPVWGNTEGSVGYNSWYTVSGGSPTQYNGFYRFQFGEFTAVTKETFTITTLADLDEQYLKNAFANIIVCDTDGASPKLRSIKDIAEVCDARYRAMLYSYNGAPKTVLVYSYQ